MRTWQRARLGWVQREALGRSRRLHGAQATRLWDKRRKTVLGIGSQLRHNPEPWKLPPEVRGFLCWWRFVLTKEATGSKRQCPDGPATPA